MNWISVWALMCILPSLLGAAPQVSSSAKAGARELWIFFSPSNGDLSTDWKEAHAFVARRKDLVLRPCLLVDDWKIIRPPSQAFKESIESLARLTGKTFGIRMWDEEGLTLSRRVRLRRLPATVLLERGKDGAPLNAHVLYGRGGNLSELVKCDSCR